MLRILTLLFICFLTTSQVMAQKQENDSAKHWAIVLSAGYQSHNVPDFAIIKSSRGLNLQLENFRYDNFGFYAGYSFFISEETPYTATDDFGHILGNREFHIELHSLYFGSHWFFLSGDKTKDFSPFIGAELSLNAVNDISSVGQVNKPNIAFAPVLGINVPIYGSFGLQLDAKYKIPFLHIEVDGNYRAEFEYFQLDLGVMFAF